MNTTNKNVDTEKTEYVDGMKYNSECGIEFTYDSVGNKEKPFLLNNGIRLDHYPTKRDNGPNNLKPFNEINYRNSEDVLKACSNGGKKAAENRRRKRNFQEAARYFLSLKASNKQIRDIVPPEILAGMTEEEIKSMDQQDIILARCLELATAGSKDHLIILRDSAGDKPTDKVQSEVNIMTDSDRALMEKLSKRLNKEQDS